MQMPISEIADRFSIVRLKLERLNDPELEPEYNALQQELLKHPEFDLDWLEELYTINGKIWDLEADIRQGKEGILGLEEVGRRAIAIRDLNKQRIAVKNKIAQETGGFKEIKGQHASQ